MLNRTSDKHPWFTESARSSVNPKRDWYIWQDGVRATDGKLAPWSSTNSKHAGTAKELTLAPFEALVGKLASE